MQCNAENSDIFSDRREWMWGRIQDKQSWWWYWAEYVVGAAVVGQRVNGESGDWSYSHPSCCCLFLVAASCHHSDSIWAGSVLSEAAWTASHFSTDTHLWKMNEWSIHASMILSPIIHLGTVQCSTLVSWDSTVKLLDVRAGCNRKKHKVSPGLSVQVSAGNFLGYPTSCGQATVLTKAVVCFQQS